MGHSSFVLCIYIYADENIVIVISMLFCLGSCEFYLVNLPQTDSYLSGYKHFWVEMTQLVLFIVCVCA